MKKFFQIVAMLTFDVLQVCLAVLWTRGVDGAGNAFLVISWAFTLMQLFLGLTSCSKGLPWNVGRFVKGYTYVRFAVKVLAYSWLGLFWLVAVYLIANLFTAAARHQHTLKTQSQASA